MDITLIISLIIAIFLIILSTKVSDLDIDNIVKQWFQVSMVSGTLEITCFIFICCIFCVLKIYSFKFTAFYTLTLMLLLSFITLGLTAYLTAQSMAISNIYKDCYITNITCYVINNEFYTASIFVYTQLAITMVSSIIIYYVCMCLCPCNTDLN
jgi:hypothetical protein